MRAMFEGGPHDGGVLDVEPGAEYVQTYAPPPRLEYDAAELGAVFMAVRVYRYKRWRVKYPDGRVEIRYCLDDGRRPLV